MLTSRKERVVGEHFHRLLHEYVIQILTWFSIKIFLSADGHLFLVKTHVFALFFIASNVYDGLTQGGLVGKHGIDDGGLSGLTILREMIFHHLIVFIFRHGPMILL